MQRQRWIAMSHRDYFQRSIAPGRRDPPYQTASFIFPQGLPGRAQCPVKPSMQRFEE
jgi:hypothetical protein